MNSFIEKSKPVLQEAVEFDKCGSETEAVSKYIEGISILMEALSCSDISTEQKDSLKVAIGKYMSRAECLKTRFKITIEFVEQYRISAGTTGHGYDKIFGKCMDDSLKEVLVNDAYIRAHHQILNFIRFCEFCVVNAKNLKLIELKTQKDASNEDALRELKRSFETKGLNLNFTFDENLHDREIRFSNGWIVKIGRGLDYFRNPGRYALGTCELNLRECHETTVDIFRVR